MPIDLAIKKTEEKSYFTAVGVQHPARIRLLQIDSIPQPVDPLLQRVAAELHFLGPDTIGLTLGYGVYLRKGYVTDRLLSHEFRHVQQYDVAGSAENFITAYLQQIFQYGYRNSPYEVDARAHEING
jgi:hypothetical protein